jgi:ketosteroid isomerase-like protein
MLRMLIAALLSLAAADLPKPLTEMADTERAFARRAAQVGVRDSFLEFFADDAIRFGEGPEPARPYLQQVKAQPPSVVELLWEPRVGDVAASGELGWLSGPASRIVHGADVPVTELAYFSIWKRQANGAFRVLIDQGITTPSAPDFADGFTRVDARDRYAGSAADAEKKLAAADRDATPPLAADGRLYRDGVLPLVGDAARARQGAERARRTTSLHAEAARSGDVGFTYGRYEHAPDDETGHYVRVWSRTRSGAWKVALEVTAPKR